MKINIVVVLIFVTHSSNGGPLNDSLGNLNDTIEEFGWRSVGYLKQPDDWHQAFVVLAKTYKEELERHENGPDKNEGDINEIHEGKSRHYKEDDLKRCENETVEIKKELLKFKSVMWVRTYQLEMGEYCFGLQYVSPDKTKMLEELKNNASRYTDTITPECQTSIGNLCSDTVNEHAVIWLHYLAFSDKILATRLRKELLDRKVDVFEFCTMVGAIFLRIGRFDFADGFSNPEPEVVLEGLKMFGVRVGGGLESVKVLFRIESMTMTSYRRNDEQGDDYDENSAKT
ncbi:uncharacterized protein LOC135837399 [Planococcus citri]|uniref:uncharacterized protein LOC135837399 n=1 Tax=Planococcus citri TaxID=170843 RepID=UPI0031F89718